MGVVLVRNNEVSVLVQEGGSREEFPCSMGIDGKETLSGCNTVLVFGPGCW